MTIKNQSFLGSIIDINSKDTDKDNKDDDNNNNSDDDNNDTNPLVENTIRIM